MFDQPCLGMDSYSNPEDILIYDEELNEQNIEPTITPEPPTVVRAPRGDLPEHRGDDAWCHQKYGKDYIKRQAAKVDSICAKAGNAIRTRAAAQLSMDTNGESAPRPVDVKIMEVKKIELDPNKHYVFKKGNVGTIAEVNYRAGIKMHRGTFYVTLHSSRSIDEHLEMGFMFDQKLTIIQKGQ